MFDEEELEKLRLAGKIASKVRRWVVGEVKPGISVLSLCEKVEEEIRRLGGQPAFPCNVDINEVGAHYTASPAETLTIPEGALVKVDLGVHIDGYIADTAVSVCLSPEYELLKEAAEQALDNAIEAIRPGVKASEVGFVVQRTIEAMGLKPIRNLTGHGIGRYLIHTGKHIPNVASIDGMRLEAGELYAVEPFVTLRDAAGEVVSGPCGNIYRVSKRKVPKKEPAKTVMSQILERFKTLPFSPRWLKGDSSKVMEGFQQLIRERHVSCYPTLIEASGKPIAQAEHTILILKDGVEVLTL
ncbi:MAG: type II methionyl aminopeptidase [Candidatus Hecatellaceae archaeon]